MAGKGGDFPFTEDGASPEKIKNYQRFFKWLGILNILRIPPLPSFPQLGLLVGPLLSLAKGRELNAIFARYKIHTNQFIPRPAKSLMENFLERLVKVIEDKN